MIINKTNLILFFSGTIINSIVFLSIGPFFVSFSFLLFGLLTVKFFRLGGEYEYKMFLRLFSLTWFVSSICFLIDLNLSYENYLKTDMYEFYDNSIQDLFLLSLVELFRVSNGIGAILLWNSVYNFFELLGFDSKEYIGVLVNIVCISFTGIFVIKIYKKAFNSNPDNLKKLIFFFSTSSLVWLFSSLHLRDVYSLFLIVINSFFWIKFFENKNIINSIYLIIISSACSIVFSFIRLEFVYFPLILFLIGSILYALDFKKIENKIAFIIISIGFIILLYFNYFSNILELYELSTNAYSSSRENENSNGESLGLLITSFPFPINIISKFILTILSPVPFWIGFKLESSYLLIKSINALYMYFTLPLFYIFFKEYFSRNILRNVKIDFLLILLIVFSLIISQSSQETRHIGNIIFIYIMFISSVNLDIVRKKIIYKNTLIYLIFVVFLVHTSWILIKAI